MSAEPTRILNFPNAPLVQEIHLYDTLASSNDTALSLGRDGVAVLALNQTAGRGQHGRTWTSKPGSSMLLSIAWHPPHELRQPAKIIAYSSLAVLWFVESFFPRLPRLKWPNDILVERKKLCGILVEQSSNGPTIIGIGLNLNQTVDDFRESGLPDATSLMVGSGRMSDPLDAALGVIAMFEKLLEKELHRTETSWANSLELLNKRVLVTRHDRSTLIGILLKASFAEMEYLCDDGSRRTLAPEAIRHMNEV